MAVTINASTSTGLVQSADTSGVIELQTNGTTVATVNTSNNVQFRSSISVGNATPTTSGAGITFPATQSASSDANTLDDYEEGTWTPTLASGFSSAPTSYSAQSGSYTKIGRLVYFQLNMDANGATANASHLKIGGLPFAAGSSGFGVGSVSYQLNFDTNATDTYHITNGSTSLDVYGQAGNARLGNDAGVNINNQILLVGYYQT